MANITTKIMFANEVSYNIDKLVTDIHSAYKDTSAISSGGVMLPSFFKSDNGVNYMELDAEKVYMLTKPCYIYSEHYNGTWSGQRGFKVFISKKSNMKDSYLLIDTKESSTAHTNNMFLVPCVGTMYMCVYGSNISGYNDSRKIALVSPYGARGISTVGTSPKESNITINGDLSGFQDVFERSISLPDFYTGVITGG